MLRFPPAVATFALVCTAAGCGSPAGPSSSGNGGEGGTAVSATGAGGSLTGGSGGSGPATGTGGGSGAPGGGDGGTADGIRRGGMCFPVCGFPDVTDPDQNGVKDGFGYEGQRSCLVAGSPAAAGGAPCDAPDLPPPPAGADGVLGGTVCSPMCSSRLTDTDGDGYGYEHGRSCIVAGTAAALAGLPCVTGLPPLPMGDGIMTADGCFPLCVNITVAQPDAAGYGFENGRACIVSASVAALQGVPCDAPDPPVPPPPPTPPPPPPGSDWQSSYTATMFGQADCAPFGFNDATNLNNSTCVARRAVQLNATNQMFFGAAGDLSTLWNGAPACTCNGGQTQGVCGSPPGCAGQTDCGQCVEIACNATGIYSFMSDGFTHNEFCLGHKTVVVQLIDACPHNHPNNTYWCTAARPNHIDLSCTAFSNLTMGRPVGDIGSINVYVRPVNCSVGLGVKTF